jgi:hypothetical protein
MRKIVWYNPNVPPTTEKKSVQIAVKLPESLYATIEAICAAQDRPVGYVARELMVRGLSLYERDGKLRDEVKPLAPVVARISPKGEIQRKFEEEVETIGTQKVPVLKGKVR